MKTHCFSLSARLGILVTLATSALSLRAGVFETDFESGLPDTSQVAGSANLDTVGGVSNSAAMKLTLSQNTAETGSWVINDFDGGALIGAFTASFKVLIGSSNATPAFGLSFCFATDLAGSFGVDGAGSGLRIVFDTFDRGGGTAPAIDVYFNGARLATHRVPVSILRTGTNYVDCVVKVNGDGTLDLTYAGRSIYSNFFCYTPISGNWGFGASTGGIADNHWIDNVKIETTPLTGPFVRSVLPGPTGARPDPSVVVRLEDYLSEVNGNSITVAVNGSSGTPQVSKDGAVTTVRYDVPVVLAAGSSNTVRVTFADTSSPPITTTLDYDFSVANYPTVPASSAVEAGVVNQNTPGFLVKVRQADAVLAATLDRAERQLAGTLIDPVTTQPYLNVADSGPGPEGVFSESGVINYDDDPLDAGFFAGDQAVPGIPGSTVDSRDNFAVEITGYLDLPAGVQTIGVRSDDGFRLTIGNSPRDFFALTVGLAATGPGTVETVLVVPQAGVYPIRLVWWEAQGDGNCELYTVNRLGERTLINDRSQPAAVKAYREASATRPYVQSVNPQPGQTGVAASTTIDATLADGSLPVVPESVQLFLNGVPVAPSVNKPTNASITTITYDPPGRLSGLSTNHVRLVYKDAANPAHELSAEWSFVVAESVGGNPPRGQDKQTGLLVLEAEHADQNVAAGGSAWVLQTDNPDYSGDGAMAALPNSGRNVNIDISTSPHLDFKVFFERTGTHYIWIRGLGDSPPGPSADDSVNVGLDGALPETSDRIGNGWVAENGFVWANTTFEDPPARFEVPTTGEHIINFWMREDGFIFDKLLLTPDVNYRPDAQGPPESERLIEKAFQQEAGPDHLLVLEAENFDANTAAGGSQWVRYTTTAGFSGSAAMEASPNQGRNVNIDTSTSPRLDYRVLFVATGTHYVWVRGLGDSPPGPSANDSVNVGLDGALPETSDRIGNGWVAENGYVWANTTFEDPPARFTVASTGEHQVNFWMREDGFIFDKLLLTTNPGYVPDGNGPPESARVPLEQAPEPIRLTIQRSGSQVEIRWTGQGLLESTSSLTNQWLPVPNSTNPMVVTPAQAAAFYRARR